MPVNPKIKMPLVWLWSVDIYFYALAFPVISCFVNRQLTVSLYALPGLISCMFGGILNLRITEKRTMAMLYDRWFLQITLFDAVVWMAYFALWMTGVFPDTWFPVASAVMHVTTVQLSIAIRSEFENRLFPESDEKTEFDNASRSRGEAQDRVVYAGEGDSAFRDGCRQWLFHLDLEGFPKARS